MSKQLLRDQSIEPTELVLKDALGISYSTYLKFLSLVSEMGLAVEWRYYNDGKSWLAKGLYIWETKQGNKKDRTIFWLSVWEGYFKVVFYIGEKYRQDIKSLDLTEMTINMIDSAKQMGKLKFFPLVFDIKENEFFNDLKMLIEFKNNSK